jgi:hypothetical protein
MATLTPISTPLFTRIAHNKCNQPRGINWDRRPPRPTRGCRRHTRHSRRSPKRTVRSFHSNLEIKRASSSVLCNASLSSIAIVCASSFLLNTLCIRVVIIFVLLCFSLVCPSIVLLPAPLCELMKHIAADCTLNETQVFFSLYSGFCLFGFSTYPFVAVLFHSHPSLFYHYI